MNIWTSEQHEVQIKRLRNEQRSERNAIEREREAHYAKLDRRQGVREKHDALYAIALFVIALIVLRLLIGG